MIDVCKQKEGTARPLYWLNLCYIEALFLATLRYAIICNRHLSIKAAMRLNYILILFLTWGCKSHMHKRNVFQCHVIPRAIILEFAGVTNKPIQTLIFCDSIQASFNYNYSYKTIVNCEMLDSLSHCIPEYPDTSLLFPYPLYAITSCYVAGNKSIIIKTPKQLTAFINCIEQYITAKEYYYPYQVLEQIRARNMDQ